MSHLYGDIDLRVDGPVEAMTRVESELDLSVYDDPDAVSEFLEDWNKCRFGAHADSEGCCSLVLSKFYDPLETVLQIIGHIGFQFSELALQMTATVTDSATGESEGYTVEKPAGVTDWGGDESLFDMAYSY